MSIAHQGRQQTQDQKGTFAGEVGRDAYRAPKIEEDLITKKTCFFFSNRLKTNPINGWNDRFETLLDDLKVVRQI